MIMMYVTVNEHSTAIAIAETILKERMANHVNIIAANHCKIWQDGKIVDSTETLLLIKTKALLYKPIEDKIIEMHLGEKPAIFSVPITQIDDTYYHFLKDGILRV
jgi:periplasmic divalent cation tolerance protein